VAVPVSPQRWWSGQRPRQPDARLRHRPARTEARGMTEIEFERKIVDLAHLMGWKVASFRPALTKAGNWVTPVKYDGKGWPDLVLVHPGRGVLIRELKSDNGTVSKEQHEWIETLGLAGANVAVWRPSDWPRIEQILTNGRA